MKAIINSVSVTGGEIKRINSEKEEGPFDACVARWAHLRDNVRTKRWEQCQPEMVADFARSMALEMLEGYGHEAAAKAGNILACCVSSSGLSGLKLDGAWLEAGASMHLNLTFEPTSPQNTEGASFGITAEADSSDEEVRAALADWAKPAPRTRMELDPIKTLPDLSVARIVAQAEAMMPGDDLDVLIASASVLLLWRNMESHNASHLTLVMSGLTNDGEAVAPGQQARITCEAKLMDKELGSVSVPDNASQFVVTARARKLQ
jgi:hypothetical protein